MTRVQVEAHAKINLDLRILARRPDGYHDIETLFQAVDLHDVLEVDRAGAGVQLEVQGEDVGPVQDNLVARAAREFLAAAGRAWEGVHIRLEKRIPAGAGLGGGSSDAAATLRALDEIFPGAVPPGRIAAIAADLGSDVPFFLGASPFAVGRGRGEVIEALMPLPALSGVVVLPSVRVATADAYRALARSREGRPPSVAPPFVAPTDWATLATAATNDFESVVPTAYPPVADALSALRATNPFLALLSGSGSASFALYAKEGEAGGATAALSGSADLRVFSVRTLSAWPDRA